MHAWAVEGDLPPGFVLRSNCFELEWPPRSRKLQSYPEVDRAEFFPTEIARQKINPAQAELLLRARTLLGRNFTGLRHVLLRLGIGHHRIIVRFAAPLRIISDMLFVGTIWRLAEIKPCNWRIPSNTTCCCPATEDSGRALWPVEAAKKARAALGVLGLRPTARYRADDSLPQS